MYGEGAIAQAGMSLSYSQPKMAGKGADKAAIWEKAKEFESVFLSSMLQPVFDSIDTDGAFGGGQGEKVFRSLLVQEYGKKMTEAGGIGLADSVYREMIKAQESN